MAKTAPIVVRHTALVDRDEFVEKMHYILEGSSGCTHHGTWIECEIAVSNLLDADLFKSEEKFWEDVKDSPNVRDIIQASMADIWEEGWSAGVANRKITENPYT